MTYQTYIRDMLDCETAAGSPERRCPFLDPQQAFIPLLTNTMLSLTGWPDTVVGTYTAAQGVYREEWSMVDDTAKIYNAFSLTGTFRNIQGDPVSSLFSSWVHYISSVYEGTMMPHMDALQDQEKDYETAIYRLVVSSDWEYVHKIGRTIGFPVSVPTGTTFNYDHDRPRVADGDQISIEFRCQGAEYNDPILIEEFNMTVATFNPRMANLVNTSDGYLDPTGALVKISKEDRKYFNYYGYPHISPATGQLSWFIDRAVHDTLANNRSLVN